MDESSFTPYWRSLNPPTGPKSWVFFAVAKLGGSGCYHPVAVVASVCWEPDWSLRGTPLTVCCQRIVTIFSDPVNHTAIRGELALADAYYTDDKTQESRLTPVELPELYPMNVADPGRYRSWDRTSVVPFPFISASLLQGVAFDLRPYRASPIRLESLATVYRDTDLEWGMVVVDITNLEQVRYGIVGFSVGMGKFIPSLEVERAPPPSYFSVRGHPEVGPLRVMDDVRPRRALSAAEYIAKFKYKPADYVASYHLNDMQVLESIPLVDSAALNLIWPSAERPVLPLSDVTVKSQSVDTEQDQATKGLIQTTICLDDFDISTVFDHVRHLPGFAGLVQEVLQGYHDILDDRPAIGRLVRLAFTRHDGHLSLELLENLSASTILAAIGNGLGASETVTSLSLCIDRIHSTPTEIATTLSQATSLKEICFLQNPTCESDVLSAHVLAALATQTEVLSHAKVTFAGAYSSALRKKFWLQATPKFLPRPEFPFQQILTRQYKDNGRQLSVQYNYIYLGDGLLTPKHFAAGFLLWLLTLKSTWNHWVDGFDEDGEAPFLAFSSAPASLSTNLLSKSEVTPILCENFAVPPYTPEYSACAPRVRDLVAGGWTALVLQEPSCGAQNTHTFRIRYAFVRPRGTQSITVENPPIAPPGPEKLEVIGLKELMTITAPEVDPSTVDFCLANVAKEIAASTIGGEPHESVVESLSVLSQADAAAALLEFLSDARALNGKHRKAINEDPENWNWYPELSSP